MRAAASGPVVVEVDGAPRVLDYAAAEALRTGAELLLARPYRSHPRYSPATALYFARTPADEASQDLRQATAHVHRQLGDQVAVRSVACEGSRLDVLAHLAQDARLLVVGRRRARGPHRTIAAQTDLALACRTVCPVTVVPRSWKPSGADHTVAVGVDGSEPSWRALECALAAAGERDAHLIVVHTTDRPRHPISAAAAVWITSAELAVADSLSGRLDHHPGLTVTRLLSSEPVIETLSRESRHAGLLVLGVPVDAGRLVGDPVTRRTLAAATCPVRMIQRPVTTAPPPPGQENIGGEFVTSAY